MGLALGFSMSPRAEQARAEAPHTGAAADPHTAGGQAEAEGPMTLHQNDVDLAIWTLITFVVFMFVLKKLAWGPIIEGLQKRETSMFDNQAAAESARIKAEKMLAEHAAKLDKVQDEVREILAEAKRDAEHTKTEILATAQKEAEATRQRAVQDIERARDQALADLFTQAGRAVYLATEQVLGRSVTEADNDRLIDEALAGFAQRKH
jgi:F-type H+-transporting ATPase subunit b